MFEDLTASARSLVLLVIINALSACGGSSGNTTTNNDVFVSPPTSDIPDNSDDEEPSDSPIAPELPVPIGVTVTPRYSPTVRDAVTLSTGTFDFTAAEFELDNNGSIENFNVNNKTTSTFDTWIIENAYLRVTLLPAYGGRILSIVNKSTGSEALYQNPVGMPYGIEEGNFLFDWLQIVGGIFPTYGPEHGKSWNQPWQLNIIEQTSKAVVIDLNWIDDFDVQTPGRFARYGNATGVELTYRISLKAGRAALDTEILIHNPTANSIDYEYWTNASLAPGSIPEGPRATAGAEIIYPLDFVSSSWCLSEPRCQQTASIETKTTTPGTFKFEQLRWFANWSDWGIFYAWPDMSLRNFWGVINHDNDEGLMRISDNQMTRGLKLWTFGFDSSIGVDPFNDASFYRPFVELWAGNVAEFFEVSRLQANTTDTQKEVYAPTVGLSGVTHANDNFIADMRVQNEQLVADVFALYPEQEIRVQLSQVGGQTTPNEIYETSANQPLSLTLPYTGDGDVHLTVTTTEGVSLFEAVLPVQ